MYHKSYNSPSGMKCCFPGCLSKRKDGIPRSYFSFPKDSSRCTLWLDKCNCKSLLFIAPAVLNKTYRLCSLHFEDKMFSNYQKNRLKSDAIPTIFQHLSEMVPLNDSVNSETLSCSTSITDLSAIDISKSVITSDVFTSSEVAVTSMDVQTTKYLNSNIPQKFHERLAEEIQPRKESEDRKKDMIHTFFNTASCMICDRSVNSTSKAASITFHRFPSKECVRVKWNNFLLDNALNPQNVTKTSLVCSQHFEQSCFILHKSRKLLQKHAVPSIIVGRLKSAKLTYPETLKTITRDLETSSVSNSIDSRSPSNVTLSFNRTLVKISESNIGVEGASPLNEPTTSSTTCINSSEIPIKKIKNELKTSFVGASDESNDDTPREIGLKRAIHQVSKKIITKNKIMKGLQQVLRRQNKKIAHLTSIIGEHNKTK